MLSASVATSSLRLISASAARHLGLALCVAVAACGGATPPPGAPSDGSPEQHAHHDAHHDGHHDEHGGHGHADGDHARGGHHVEGPLGELHEVIAPVWHAEPGAVRVEAACAKTGAMKERTTALAAPQAMPAAAQKDAAGWKTEVETLGTSIDALATACAAPGRSDVEPALSKVHDGFHRLMERAK